MPDGSLMDKSLGALVVAICADFDRRERAIKEKKLPMKVLMEYKYLNLRILEGVMEVVGIENAPTYIREIGERCGYANSKIAEISEYNYKRLKNAAKRAIARKLALIN